MRGRVAAATRRRVADEPARVVAAFASGVLAEAGFAFMLMTSCGVIIALALLATR